MFDFRIRPRVKVSHEGGKLTIAIPHHFRFSDDFVLIPIAIVVIGGSWYVVLPGLLQQKTVTAALLYSVIILPFLTAPIWIFRQLIQGVFGVQELTVGNGRLTWIRKALWWKRRVDANLNDVTKVVAMKSWVGYVHVELTVRRRTYKIGDWLLPEEADKIVHELNRALYP